MDFFRVFIDSGKKADKYPVSRPFSGHIGSGSGTFFSLSATKSTFSVKICAELPGSPVSRSRPEKGRVFEDDCLEFFLRPQISPDNPFPAAFYFGWEVNPQGALLDYRVGVGAEGIRMIGNGGGRSKTDGSGAKPGVEPVYGILRDAVCGVPLTFDYDWHSSVLVSSSIDPEPSSDTTGLWTVDLSIPWTDFGFLEAPRGERWYFTVNRIEQGADGNPGLATLLVGTDMPSFHQPDSFVSLQFD